MSAYNRKKMNKAEWRIKNYPFTCVLIGLVITLASLASASFYMSVADGYHFDQKIGGYLTYAESAPTFNLISLNLNRAEVGINSTFLGNQTTTYNSPFYWDHYYPHSIIGYVAYLNSIQARIQVYNTTYTDMIHNSSSVIQIRDWYTNNTLTIQGLINNDGATYSGLESAYFLNVEGSLAYWLEYFILTLVFFFFILAGVATVEDGEADSYSGYRD